MAFAERYASVAGAGGHDGLAEGSAWTLAEALTNAVAGQRVNVIKGAYSSGADVISGIGAIAQMIIFRGYNTSIGDLDSLSRNSDNTLNVTDFPVVTLTGSIDMSVYSILQNMSFTGSINADMIGNSNTDYNGLISCKVLNTANNAAAYAIRFDNGAFTINCDLECSGAAYQAVVNFDLGARVIGCRIKGTSGGNCIEAGGRMAAINNHLIGADIGIVLETAADTSTVFGNTAYNLGTFFAYPDLVQTYLPFFISNHVTDCTKYLDNLYAGTSDIIAIEAYNRTRDNTTPRTGFGDGLIVGEVTTDTGDETTDYTNASGEDFSLIDSAPGVGAGLPVSENRDIGVQQRAAGGGGGGAVSLFNGTIQ